MKPDRRFGRRVLLLCAALLGAALLAAPCGVFAEEMLNFADEGGYLRISEICPKNASLKDENRNLSDWLELYNPTGAAIRLAGYALSDDARHLYDCPLPDVEIEPGGYLVLFCSKQSTGAKILPMKLSASGETLYLTAPDGETTSVTYPALTDDQTYARQPDGAYHIVNEPTPGAVNGAGAPYVETPYVAEPTFSHASGFYDEGFSLEIAAAGKQIYYTMNCATPSASSRLYAAPIAIRDATSNRNVAAAHTNITIDPVTRPDYLLDKAVIVRAVAVDANGNASRVVTKTYFIGFDQKDGYADIPIVSLVLDPKDLFSDERGIYVLGDLYNAWAEKPENLENATVWSTAANYRGRGRAWEREASAQFFTAQRDLVDDQVFGVRINGNYSRGKAQKSFKLYARGEYGGDETQYAFWNLDDGGAAYRPEHLLLRGGSGTGAVRFMNLLAHTLLEPSDLPVAQGKTCQLFLNGEYWGVYNLREAQDDRYIEEHFGVDEDDVVIKKNYAFETGTAQDIAAYRAFDNYVTSHDLNDPACLAYVTERMDLGNYLDYLAANIYLKNEDWVNNNFTLWRSRSVGDAPYADGKWRWLAQDLDLTMSDNMSASTIYDRLIYEPFVMAFLENTDIRDQLFGRIMDLANSVFRFETVNQTLTAFADRYRGFMEMTYKRYGDGFALDSYDEGVERIRTFFENRPETLAAQLNEAFSVHMGLCTLKVELSNADAGALRVNSLTPSLGTRGSWSGTYFTTIPVTLTATPNAGWQFDGWYQDGRMVSAEETYVCTPARDTTIRAVFSPYEVVVGETAVSGAVGVRNAYDLKDASGAVVGRIVAENSELAYEDGAFVWEAETAWRDAALVLDLNAAGCESLRFRASLAATSKAPSGFALTCGETTYQAQIAEADEFLPRFDMVSLPDAPEDAETLTLRLTADSNLSVAGKDGALSGDKGKVRLRDIRLYGRAARLSLDDYKRAADDYRAVAGADAEVPVYARDDETLTQDDIDRAAEDLRQKTLDAAVQASIQPLAQVIGDRVLQPNDELSALVALTIPEAYAGNGAYAAVTLERAAYADSAYVYRLDGEGATRVEGSYDAATGVLRLINLSGTYALMPAPIEDYQVRCEVSAAVFSGAMVRDVLRGQTPRYAVSIDMTVAPTFAGAYACEIPTALYGGKRGCLYFQSGDTLRLVDEPRLTEGVLTMENPVSGVYILMPDRLDELADGAALASDARAEAAEAAQADENASSGSRKLWSFAIVGAAALVLILAIILAVTRRKRR